MPSKEEWFEKGREEGAAVGSEEIEAQERNFLPHEDKLALGHHTLEGMYSLIRRPMTDFHSLEQGAAWMAGLHEGVASAGAQVGYTTTIADVSDSIDASLVLCVFVTSAPRLSDATVK
ncbi:hypothetical protein ACC757_24340 [Rhizobium ruizarguesonis]